MAVRTARLGRGRPSDSGTRAVSAATATVTANRVQTHSARNDVADVGCCLAHSLQRHRLPRAQRIQAKVPCGHPPLNAAITAAAQLQMYAILGLV